MAIKVEMLRCFCAVAQAGNLADAADVLGRTQSAVSMMLKQLEANLGSPLFEGERKNRLTALGAQVLQLGQQQLKHFDSTVEAIETLAKAPQGLLRISAVPSVAALAFPHVVRHISTRHPGLRIELRDADSQQVLEALAQGWADIGIASTRQVLNGVTVRPLFSDPFGLVLSGAHPLARGTDPVQVADVFSVPFLRNTLCDQIRTPGVHAHLDKVDVTVHNTQSLLAMLCEGDWATLLPRLTMRLAPGGLAFRPVVGLPDRRQVFLYVRDRPSAPDAVRDVQQVIEGLEWPEGS